MHRRATNRMIAIVFVCSMGCAVSPPSLPQQPVSKGSPLAKVQTGMTFTQVVGVLGPPTSQSRELTLHAFNPFSIGPEAQITRFHYVKLGRVVFVGPDFHGQGASVIAVEEDPAEPGYD
jgi:hypothetical protein